jgi:hypothetical protein
MRRPLPMVSLLLAAALFAGPVLAAVHDADHGLQPGASHSCVVCVYAHGAGHGAVPAAPRVAVDAVAESPEAPPVTANAAVTVRLHPIRGPPGLL